MTKIVISFLFQTGFLSEDHVISHSRHVSGNRVVRMNLANLPGEDDDAGKSVEFDFHQFVLHFSVGKLLVQIVLIVAKKIA